METKDVYEESFKILMKEIKELNKLRDIPCSWIERLKILKMSVLHNLNYRFNAIPIKLPMAFSQNKNKKFHNLYGNTKDPEQPK